MYQYDNGWFGDLAGFKYVFPTTALPGHVWYISFKNGCGLIGDCAYNISSIEDSASRVASLIDHESQALHGDRKKVFLAGFSEGAQLTSYMQFVKLDYALGGAVVMDGFPLPPLCDMPGHDSAAARKNASYFGQDMNFMIYQGTACPHPLPILNNFNLRHELTRCRIYACPVGGSDPIFPAELTMQTYAGIFEALNVVSTLKVNHTEPGMTHTVTEAEFQMMNKFIRAY